MPRTASFPSGAGSRREGRGRDFSREQPQQQQKSFEKEHLCQQLPPPNKSFLNVNALYYFNIATLSSASQFQGHCSLKLLAGWTVKRSCLIYEVGQTEAVMQKENGQPGVFPSLSHSLPLIFQSL